MAVQLWLSNPSVACKELYWKTSKLQLVFQSIQLLLKVIREQNLQSKKRNNKKEIAEISALIISLPGIFQMLKISEGWIVKLQLVIQSLYCNNKLSYPPPAKDSTAIMEDGHIYCRRKWWRSVILPYQGTQNRPTDSNSRGVECMHGEMSQVKQERQKVNGCWNWVVDTWESLVLVIVLFCVLENFHYKKKSCSPSSYIISLG